MMSRTTGPLIAFMIAVVPQQSLAQACEDGQVLRPGEGCEITVKWGYDHWIMADFPRSAGNAVEFSHLEGQCNVSLFGPEELDNDVIGPEQVRTRSTFPGEYHLFTRAITVAKEACRYRVAVN